jgi:LmbE family N-acetylglucosaminyl deacetylase
VTPRLAAVFAHPDDDAYTLSGSILRREGDVDVTIVLLTSGGNGPIWEPVATRATLADAREREEASWAASVGVPNARIEFLRYTDWHVPDAPFEEAVERVRAILEDAAPHVVVTFGPDGMTHHHDHVRGGEIGDQAFARARASASPGAFQRLYHVALRRSTMDEYYRAVAERGLPFGDQDTFLNPVGVPDETIAVDVDVIDLYERKVAAISQHRSQIGELERLPRDLRPLHLAHECFVQAWPERPIGGPLMGDLFDGVTFDPGSQDTTEVQT